MAKFPRGGGSGRYDCPRNADRSLGHVMVVRIGSFALAAWNQRRRRLIGFRSCITATLRSPKVGPPHFECSDGAGGKVVSVASAAHFEPVAWWYAREEIGRGLREHYGPANDLPPRLQVLVEELDKPRSTRLARLCVLAFIAVIAAASFHFHFVF
jgi:hypothetical protein